MKMRCRATRSRERGDERGILGAPQPVVHAVVGVGLGDGLGRRRRVERARRDLRLVAVQAEDGREVRADVPQDLEPVRLRGGERLLVRDDDALAELVQPHRRHEPAAPQAGARPATRSSARGGRAPGWDRGGAPPPRASGGSTPRRACTGSAPGPSPGRSSPSVRWMTFSGLRRRSSSRCSCETRS